MSTAKVGSSINHGDNYQGGKRASPDQYCTQKCLLGLVQGRPLDRSCPNVSFYKADGLNHPINGLDFPTLLREQLAEDLDNHCEPLGLYGAIGYLFRITLASYGYVFVAKGLTRSSRLRHEGKIYEHMKSLQGHTILVHLGNLDLVHRYYLDWHPIRHFLLLVWAGEYAGYNTEYGSCNDRRIEREAKRTWNEVWKANVDQGDRRSPNFLLSTEVNRVMLIDFERASLRNETRQTRKDKPSLPVDINAGSSSRKRRSGAKDLVDFKYAKMRTRSRQRRSDDGLMK